MLIKYAHNVDGQIFYKHNSNIIPRVGETVIFDAVNYDNCVHEFMFVNNKKVDTDGYIIDNLDTEIFTVVDVCYVLYGDDIEVDVTVKDYDFDNEDNDYLNNLAKDVNVPYDC